jgi:hypothetical protein
MHDLQTSVKLDAHAAYQGGGGIKYITNHFVGSDLQNSIPFLYLQSGRNNVNDVLNKLIN